jgi:hypothetical protein
MHVAARSKAQSRNFWDYGFEYRCSSLVFGVSCVGSGLYHELITQSQDTKRGCVCVCVCLLEKLLGK